MWRRVFPIEGEKREREMGGNTDVPMRPICRCPSFTGNPTPSIAAWPLSSDRHRGARLRLRRLSRHSDLEILRPFLLITHSSLTKTRIPTSKKLKPGRSRHAEPCRVGSCWMVRHDSLVPVKGGRALPRPRFTRNRDGKRSRITEDGRWGPRHAPENDSEPRRLGPLAGI
jgi:hypothetical protein